jgi:hypothetical protein
MIGANRVGTMTVGFATVPAAIAVAAQDGGTTSVTVGGTTLTDNALAVHSEATPTLTLTGCTTSPTGVVRAVKHGQLVTLYVPTITGTSNTTAATLTGLPAELRPTRDQSVLCRVSNGAAGIVLGLFQVATGGTITLGADLGGGAFNNTLTKGIQLQTLTYSLD